MEKLTDEILLIVLKDQLTDDLLSISQVNRRLRNVAKDATLYRHIRFQNKLQLSSKSIHTLFHRYKEHIQTLTLEECFWMTSYKLKLALESCTNLIELNLTGSNLSVSALDQILANNSTIKKLALSIPEQLASIPLLNTSNEPTETCLKLRNIFKNISSLKLRFKSLPCFEHFLPVFDTNTISVYEFGLEYLSDHTSAYFSTIGNTYSVYIKSTEKFPVCLSDSVIANRFLHFNLMIMDFVIQTVTKAADTGGIVSLLAPGTTNSLIWKYISSVFQTMSYQRVDLSYAMLGKQQMTWLSKLHNITYLNLFNVNSFKLNLMKAIAFNNKNLHSLNLTRCEDWLEKELHGLEALVTHCTKLEELNLHSLHIHAYSTQSNKLCTLLSKLPSLKSLALPACGLVNNLFLNSPQKQPEQPTITGHQRRLSTSKSISNLVLASEGMSSQYDSSSNSNDSQEFASYYTRHARSSQEDDAKVARTGSGLDFLEKCTGLEVLEIVDTGFNSAFSKVNCNQDQYFCPQTVHLKDKVFLSICKLKNLKKLTLAGLPGVGTFSSLCEITSQCEELEELSIAHCGLCGHTGSLSSLRQAIINCKRLKKFRLDQPYFHVKENILEAFHSCPQLQVLCLINKSGKIPKRVQDFISLMQKCTKLVGFFLFSGASVSESKKIQSSLNQMFGKTRQSSCITVLSYFNSLTEEGLKKVPYVYLRDVLRFESTVASSS